MLNRRSLRVKVMQSLFAFQQCKDANYLLSTDLIEDRFLPDLNSMEVQDKKALGKQKKEAVKVFEKAYKKEYKSEENEDNEIQKIVNDAIVLYKKTDNKDFDYIRKGVVM
jgi:N utilization substance protein B